MTKSILPLMYAALAKGSGDLAIGTRLKDAGGGGSLSPPRQALSDMGAWFFRQIAGTPVSDPMSGFFMIRREIVSGLAPRLSPDGFKILVDVILSAGSRLKIVEVPYVFRKRHAGESKLTPLVGMDFLGLVVHHATAGLLPIRFVLFASIGVVGLVVHIVVLSAVLHWFRMFAFDTGQLIATIVAMGSNFILNNEITYRPYRYSGPGLIAGFMAFALGCSLGALANIDIASWLYTANGTWWVAGLRWRAVERRVELRGQHQPRLAPPPPRLAKARILIFTKELIRKIGPTDRVRPGPSGSSAASLPLKCRGGRRGGSGIPS